MKEPDNLFNEVVELHKFRKNLKDGYERNKKEIPQSAILLHTLSPSQKIDLMARTQNKFGLLQQQNERHVNLKKQNNLKKALELISKSRTPIIDQDKILGNAD